MPVILVTNDDGIDAIGLRRLAEAVSPLGKVLVAAPTIQRSGESKSLTFSRPLRIARSDHFASNSIPSFSIDGTPADCTVIGKFLCKKEFGREPDLLVSGINSGDNTSVHALLTSGTCAAAFEGALIGIPSIAFSMEVQSSDLFYGGTNKSDYTIAARRAAEIAKIVLEEPLQEDIKFLNVNFPGDCKSDTPIEIVRLAKEKYSNEVIEAKDPRGVTVYWIWGDLVSNIANDTDSHALLHHKTITITPISLGFGRWSNKPVFDYFRRKNIALYKK